MTIDIKVGSITNAQRGLEVLKSAGYNVSLGRMEKPKKSDGCGYVLRVSGNVDGAAALLRQKGVRVIGVDDL